MQREADCAAVVSGAEIVGAVPQRVDIRHMPEEITVRFRVRREMRDYQLCVSCGARELLRRKKRIMTPGQMEEITLRRDQLGDGEIRIWAEANEK